MAVLPPHIYNTDISRPTKLCEAEMFLIVDVVDT